MPGSGQLAVVCFGRCCAIRKEDVDKRRDQRTRPDRLFDDCGEARLFARQTALRADIRGHRNDRRECIRASPIANGLEDLVAGGPRQVNICQDGLIRVGRGAVDCVFGGLD